MINIFVNIHMESRSETIAYPAMSEHEMEQDGKRTFEICKEEDPQLTPHKLLSIMQQHNRYNHYTGYESI